MSPYPRTVVNHRGSRGTAARAGLGDSRAFHEHRSSGYTHAIGHAVIVQNNFRDSVNCYGARAQYMVFISSSKMRRPMAMHGHLVRRGFCMSVGFLACKEFQQLRQAACISDVLGQASHRKLDFRGSLQCGDCSQSSPWVATQCSMFQAFGALIMGIWTVIGRQHGT